MPLASLGLFQAKRQAVSEMRECDCRPPGSPGKLGEEMLLWRKGQRPSCFLKRFCRSLTGRPGSWAPPADVTLAPCGRGSPLEPLSGREDSLWDTEQDHSLHVLLSWLGDSVCPG